MSSPAPNDLRDTAPLVEDGRIVPLDVLRGVALLGILLMNVQSFAMPSDAYMNPAAYGDLTGANLVVWLLCHVVADQKFMSIFSMLFGAGVLLMADRARGAATRLHYRRMAVLIGLGLLHAHLLWSGDILFTYGVCGLLVYPARRLRPRTLIGLGLLVQAVPSVFFLVEGLAMRRWPPNVVAIVESEFWRAPAADVARELAAFRDSWLRQQPLRHDDATAMETFLFVVYAAWKAGGLMLVGMGLLRLGVLTGSRTPRFYRRLLASGLLVGLPLILVGVWTNFRAGWDVRWSLFLGSTFNYWGSFPLALAWVAAVMLWCQSERWAALRARAGAVGRTALSNYLLQSVLCTLLFYGDGLALFGRVERTGQIALVVAVWLVQLATAPWWLARFRFGPVEWLWRSLTYGRAQRLVRSPVEPLGDAV